MASQFSSESLNISSRNQLLDRDLSDDAEFVADEDMEGSTLSLSNVDLATIYGDSVLTCADQSVPGLTFERPGKK